MPFNDTIRCIIYWFSYSCLTCAFEINRDGYWQKPLQLLYKVRFVDFLNNKSDVALIESYTFPIFIAFGVNSQRV